MALGSLFRTKPLDTILAEVQAPEQGLRRALGPVHITLLGVGAIIGAGIFATVGTAAAGDLHRPGAGPALVVSFLITAIVCGFTALCYAELAAMVPVSGSAYTYSYATLGELVAWIIGWDLIIEYAVGNIAVAISWAGYFKELVARFGLIIPDWLSMDYRTAARVVDPAGVHTVLEEAPHLLGVPVVFNLVAVGIVALITLLLVWGIRESARFNAVMVLVKIAVLAFFVVLGASFVHADNWRPFAPNGFAGVSAGAAIIFFAYIGFDAVSTVAEETRDPQRNIPFGILASLVICTLFYVAVAAIFTGLIPYNVLTSKLGTEQAEPLTMALRYAAPEMGWAVALVAFGAVVATTAVLLVFQLGQPRILFAMARDGLLPRAVAKVHPRFRTPHVATILTGLFVGGFAAVASIDEMVDLTNIGTLFAFILVCAGVIALRRKEPNRPRPFRVPGGWRWAAGLYAVFAVGLFFLPLGPAWRVVLLAAGAAFFALLRRHIFPSLGIISCLYLIYYLPPTSWLRFAAWLNLGFVLFVVYGSVKSRLTGRSSDDPLAHDRRTARQGAWLYLAGVLLLFAARGLDLVIKGFQQSHSVAEALVAATDTASWLEVSWFLLVPLLLETFVLAPVIIRRARRARGPALSGPSLSMVLAAALALLSCCYIGAVASSRRPELPVAVRPLP